MATTSLVPLQPDGEEVPFFFVHAEFGHVYFAQDLADLVGPHQPMYGLQSRGLDGREEPLSTIPEMAEHYVKCLKTVQPVGPYRLGGFCTGAFLALEMANQLQAAGEEVSHLAVFSTDASWRNLSSMSDSLRYHCREMAKHGLADALRYLTIRIRFRLHRIYSAGVFYLPRLYAIGGRELPARLRYVHIGELNYRASLDFNPGPFQGTISYFQGEADQHRDPRPYWGGLSDGLEIHTVPGEATFIFDPPLVDRLASALSESLSSRPINTRPVPEHQLEDRASPRAASVQTTPPGRPG